MTATFHDIARYYRNAGLVGEDQAALTALLALAGDASVILRGYSGTGKTHCADITMGDPVKGIESLVPDTLITRIDMLSKLGIWSPGVIERVEKARIVYFPEQQNAGDNEEVVKVVKKWGDGKDAERERNENYGRDTGLAKLPCRTFVSTAAITNEAHEKSFDAESARRVVKLSTNPSEDATARVLNAKADVLVRGRENTRIMPALDVIRVRKHVEKVFLENHDAVTSIRFFGAHELLAAIPKSFPEARSAFALFEKVLLGAARFIEDEVRVGSEVFLSPQRVAEVWAFYGDVIVENALKFDTSDRAIINAFPQPVWNGEAPTPDSCLDLNAVMRKLKKAGLTDPALVTRQIGVLVTKGFLAEADGFRNRRWHRTGLADLTSLVDWNAVIDACVAGAKAYLPEGPARDAYLAKCEAARGPQAMTNPITGEVGPISGEKSVLYANSTTGDYAPVGKRDAQPKGIFAY
jgi:hypothetical protein